MNERLAHGIADKYAQALQAEYVEDYETFNRLNEEIEVMEFMLWYEDGLIIPEVI